MNKAGHSRRWLVALVVAGVVALGGCVDGDDRDDGATGSGGQPRATTTTTALAVSGVDFVAGSEVDLGDGWRLAPCESGPPLFCARFGGENQAVVELQTYAAAKYETMRKVLDAGGSNDEALRAEAADFFRIFEEDRPAGCGRSYAIDRIGPQPVTVGGSPGILYGFDGKQDGRHVERALNFATIVGSKVHMISTSAIDDGTCMDDRELSEFTIAELTRLQPVLVRVIAASKLP